ncbi:Plasmodium exported protein, unknown function [Plasmodium malariae]|uniref:Uncharacterized protein n=1 Tax=Plasmodium malariae TaxID=5858 RepID=A0A1C3KAL1_PLAMA|nr:Plasmodium exported protein, unknown function [Plasmodium malariae]
MRIVDIFNMEKRFKLIIFIKIYIYIIIYWIFNSYSDTSMFIIFLGDNYGFDRKLDKRIYRLLGKCEKGIFSNVGDLELKIPYNTKRKKEKLLTTDNEKWYVYKLFFYQRKNVNIYSIKYILCDILYKRC